MAAELGRATAVVMGAAMVAVTAGVVMAAVAPARGTGAGMGMGMGTETGTATARIRTAVRDPGRDRVRAAAVTEGRRDLRRDASTRSPARRFSR